MSGVIEQQRFMCAIGAMQTVVAIPKAVPVLHSGPGCGTMVAGFFERSTGYSGGNTAPCTNVSENEVIFGGVQKLEELIRHTYQVLKSDLQVVLTGCTSAIVGDDVQQVAKQFAEAGRPLVFAETAGFKGTNYESHSVVVNAVIDQFADKYADRAAPRDPKLVNLFASIPYQDPFWKGNLEEYKRLIEGIGLRVNVLFGPCSTGIAEWKTVPQAAFSVLISPWYGLPIVQHLEEKYGQPYFRFPYVPIGGNESSRFLRELAVYAGKHGADINLDAADAFVKREEDAFYEEIDNLATFLLEFRYGLPAFVHILHDAGYVLGISKFLLHETGIVPKEQFVTDKVPEQYQADILKIASGISSKREVPVFFQPDGGLAQEAILNAAHEGRGLIIGCGWDKDLARKKSYDFLSAALPSPYRLVMTTPYAGYRGGLRLIEDIYNQALATYR
ncbi:nitrogenase component 1 [Treponema endosymbiont of Eucomonympha sp.]|uniref:nitrogenase component 1 n=1 Tax=Treponema endosymbiont of Eucomonympha sp. TaxID=1580831 RepID=UPI00075090F5|nr:nitrogenase component 1 [Treponema endosymbiont of Eucomonympha sp.]